MEHEDRNAKHEIRRAKTLAERFARLEREIASLEHAPSMQLDPALELDATTRALADEWLDEQLGPNVPPSPTFRAPNGLRG